MALFSLFSGSKPRLVQTGPDGKVRSHGLDRPALTIGRGMGADIVVDDPYLAPIHARMERQSDGTWTVRRMALNPIVVRDEAVLQTAAVAPGDVIRLGQAVSFQLVVKAPGKEEAERAPAGRTAGTAAPREAGAKPAAKPLLKNPRFLGAVGAVYLLMTVAVGYSLLSGDEEAGGDAPSAATIAARADGILPCLESARRMRALSPASFRGSVGGRTAESSTTGYAALALADEPAGEPLAAAVAPIAADYRRAALAGLAAEVRGSKREASRFYAEAFNLVPDVTCPAAQFVLERRSAVDAVPEE